MNESDLDYIAALQAVIAAQVNGATAMNEPNETNEIPSDWWVPIDSDEAWIRQQVFDYERELYELREWWVRPQQLTRQLELPLDEPKQPRPYAPF